MKFLSIDVGLKNLSYILIDIERECFEIFEWNNVDVMKCYTDLKWVRTSYERFSKPELTQCCIENDIDTTSAKTKDDFKRVLKLFLRSKKIRKDTTLNYQKLVQNLDVHFERIIKQYDIDVVLIENQPCFKNPTMKSIQMILFSICCLNIPTSTVSFISAGEKMKYLNSSGSISEIPKSYKETKAASVKAVSDIVQHDTWSEVLKNSKKKDDLSDVFLQAFAFFHNSVKK